MPVPWSLPLEDRWVEHAWTSQARGCHVTLWPLDAPASTRSARYRLEGKRTSPFSYRGLDLIEKKGMGRDSSVLFLTYSVSTATSSGQMENCHRLITQ
ncbi:unnamed protein product [Knipowitschia caucasica]|uniref:Uncharacterized protein n=1 Tax=Knipowitschia caucasica TaxID=637954 RepID=A0AAV2LT95_KNICA